jgi:hypothetical protein
MPRDLYRVKERSSAEVFTAAEAADIQHLASAGTCDVCGEDLGSDRFAFGDPDQWGFQPYVACSLECVSADDDC